MTNAGAAVQRMSNRWTNEGTGTTFSAGVAIHRPEQCAIDTLHLADLAIYEAKRTGRDRVVVSSVEMPTP